MILYDFNLFDCGCGVITTTDTHDGTIQERDRRCGGHADAVPG
jgi:hypothetical protein